MKFQKQTGVILSTTVMLLLGGCGNVQNADVLSTEVMEQEANNSNGVVSLKVWSDASNFDMLNTMIDSFKQKYANEAQFEITLEDMSEGNAKDYVLGDVHEAADLFAMTDDQMDALVAGGALYPVPNASEVAKNNIEGSITAATINDVLYAYPMTADNGYFMYYNKQYFSEQDVQSLDTMLQIADENGKQITMDWSSGWYLYAFFGNTGLDFGINEDGVTNYCNWNATDTEIKGVDVANAMLNISCQPGFLSGGDDALLAGARDGSVIAGVSGCWNATEMKSIWGSNYGAVKMPTYTCAGKQVQMSSFSGYKYMGVNTYSANPEWAAKLADWLTNEENQTIRFKMRNQGPSNINAASSSEVAAEPAIKAVLDQSQYAKLQRAAASYWAPVADFGVKMAEGNPNKEKLQDIMDNMVKKITASVAE